MRARRSNPDCLCGKTLDCSAPLAMTRRHSFASHHSVLRKTCAAIRPSQRTGACCALAHAA
ncbi:hypothetical protein XH86_03190 [Bradyrhizobium guangdongense]|uniref:Uncharacterized protein n=1 Tax=Bradyrhizobium guangdongense TaxID=1325090 RepID=A0ABX6U975_9BRAD|nr:hypothetical protein X265_03190 [Bradyrhizobium guangdongense]QOZ57866.1 hypothetical protein XH86_03190 [Bradyrhizobium guangdongense]